MTEQVLGGRYRIVRHVARGGMAEVFLGHDQLLDRPVAVKVLVPDLAADATFVERFRREAQAAAGLNHHNIVSVYDFGQDDGAPFIVMEYVDGPTLRDIIKGQAPLPAAKVIELGGEIAAGLGAAHQSGFIHRDMKPANVLLTQSGNVKVADFGIARAAQSAREALTMPGAVVGTATYLSPEQAMGEDLDHRSDLYSLGMVIYEMLAGRAPFTGDSPIAVAYKHVNEVPPPPSVYNPDVPAALDAVVMRALAKNPDHRQQSAEALRAELLEVQFGAAEPEATAMAGAPIAAATAGAGEATALPPTAAASGMAAAAAATAAAVSASDPTATSIAASPPTSVMPPPTGVDVGPPVVAAPPPRPYAGPPPPDRGVYRRRQMTVIIVALLAAVALIALVSSLAGGDDDGAATITVPSVVGFNVNDAVREVSEAGLEPDIKVDEEVEGAEDEVARQDPEGGATAKQGDKITLFLPAGSTDTSVETVPSTAPPTTEAPATTQATSPPATQPQATIPPTVPQTTVPETVPPTTATPTTVPPTVVSVPTT